MIDSLDDNLFETDEDQIIKMVYHNRIDISKGIDPLKSIGSKKCVACQY